jgi:outer membrane protein assembly factor BamB
MKWLRNIGIIIFLFISFILVFLPYKAIDPITAPQKNKPGFHPDRSVADHDTVKFINATFLGNEERNYYGDSLPDKLNEFFHISLGSGETVVNKWTGAETWSGAGWTGQPLLIEENGILFLVIGAYDHHLKKINATNGKIVWQYPYDDIIKGTGTLWHNPAATVSEMQNIIMQGSRLGVGNDLEKHTIPSFRAVSLKTGRALWKFNIKKTNSYSRDVDGSALILNDTVYIGFENGVFTVFRPDPLDIVLRDSLLQPGITEEHNLYDQKDQVRHGGNLVIESSPCYLNGHIYITAGSGHVYGYNLKKKTIDWDFYTGSDMDGSPVVTADSCILVTVEKQYIEGPGGVIKLDPRKLPDQAVVWYFPTESRRFAEWEGGIVGSAAVNQRTLISGYPLITAFTAIDGNLYVVSQNKTVAGKTVTGTDGITLYPTPQLLYKYKTGPSISTPIITGNRLLAAGYDGIYLFSFDKYMQFTLLDHKAINCEATPVAYRGRVYIASRDGNLYCFGK